MRQFFFWQTGWIPRKTVLKFESLCDLIGMRQDRIDPSKPAEKSKHRPGYEPRLRGREVSTPAQFVAQDSIGGTAPITL
jgi:hypothetical protein